MYAQYLETRKCNLQHSHTMLNYRRGTATCYCCQSTMSFAETETCFKCQDKTNKLEMRDKAQHEPTLRCHLVFALEYINMHIF